MFMLCLRTSRRPGLWRVARWPVHGLPAEGPLLNMIPHQEVVTPASWSPSAETVIDAHQGY